MQQDGPTHDPVRQQRPPQGQQSTPAQAGQPPSGPPPGWGASGPSPGYGGPGGPPQKTNGKAIAALILGIAGCCLIGWLGAIPALILGIMAKKEIERDPMQGGRGMAIAGIVLGIIGIVAGFIWIIMILIWGFAIFAFLADMEGFCEENPDHDLCEAMESRPPDGDLGLLAFAPLLARPGGRGASFRPCTAAWAG